MCVDGVRPNDGVVAVCTRVRLRLATARALEELPAVARFKSPFASDSVARPKSRAPAELPYQVQLGLRL